MTDPKIMTIKTTAHYDGKDIAAGEQHFLLPQQTPSTTEELEEAEARIAELEAALAEADEALGRSKGYLLNAMIDLQTGCTKQTAINTIKGGLRMIDDVLSKRGKL